MTKVEIIQKIIELKPRLKNNQGTLYSKSLEELKQTMNKAYKEKTMSNSEVLKELVEKYGDKQVVVAIEELSELQKELCKNLRGKENKENLIEEMADVYIMLAQMQLLFGINNYVLKDKINEKIERTKERLL